MSVPPVERERSADVVAGFLAAAAVFVALIGVAYRPLRLIPPAIFLALLAAAMGGRNARLAAFAVAVTALCFALGLAVAVLAQNPLF